MINFLIEIEWPFGRRRRRSGWKEVRVEAGNTISRGWLENVNWWRSQLLPQGWVPLNGDGGLRPNLQAVAQRRRRDTGAPPWAATRLCTWLSLLFPPIFLFPFFVFCLFYLFYPHPSGLPGGGSVRVRQERAFRITWSITYYNTNSSQDYT